MILSIETERGKTLFDGFTRIGFRPLERCGIEGSFVDCRSAQTPDKPCGPSDTEIELFNNGIFVERILVNSPAFLMNDRGETIERI